MRPPKLDWVRNEITRLRGAIRAQERENPDAAAGGGRDGIRRAHAVAHGAKVDDLCRERELRKAQLA